MLLAVDGLDIPGQVSDRPRQEIQILRQCGVHERQGEFHPATLELVDRAGGQDRSSPTAPAPAPSRGSAPISRYGLAVDADHAGQPMRPAGPVNGVGVVS
jgi:hypothetical protein